MDFTHSTLAFITGLFPCSTLAETKSFCLERSSMVSADPQQVVRNGKVSFEPAFEETVTNE